MIPMDTGEGDAEMMVDINTTPLVDVLLVLLVMLIITIPIQLHAVNLEMPGRQAAPPPTEPEIVRLDVTAAGAFLWNGEVLASREALEARLRDAAGRPEQPEIHLRPDRAARYDAVAAALASAQRHGLVKIGIIGSEQFARWNAKSAKLRPMQQAAAWILLYLVLPVWIAVGFADGLCHRATNIATTSGLKENLLHWLMFAEVSVGVAAALWLDITAAVLVLVFAVFIVHEATVYWDLDYSTLRRDVGPFEQMVHSFQEMLPLVWLLLLSFIAMPQALAIFRRGDVAADWSLRLKSVPLPAEYLLTAIALTVVFNVMFLLAETWSCLRARKPAARASAAGRVEPRLD